MRNVCAQVILLCGAVLPATAGEPAADETLAALLENLPGIYAGDAPDPRAGDGSTQRIVHSIRPILAAQFGQQVFYYRLSSGTAAGPVLQQKIFAFDAVTADGQMRMRSWVFPPDYPDQLASTSPAQWQALSVESLLSFPVACAFVWRVIPGGYEGIVSAERCEFESPAFAQPVRPEMSYRLLGDRFEWTEILYGEAGNVLASTSGTLPALRQ